MSTGRRLAKRSILGTRVCAPGQDGRYYPGIIQATKMNEENVCNHHHQHHHHHGHNVYSVLFDGFGEKTVGEFIDSEIIGPGFQSVCSCKLKPGQKVYVTHNGREVYGTVICHFPQIDEVQIRVNLSSMTSATALIPTPTPNNNNNNGIIGTTTTTATDTLDLKKKLEEVRLLESRKSARLHDQDQDYSRLAEFGPMETRKRPTSHVIDVPTPQSNRKRRPSSPDDFDIMDNCAAAMVLMSLSCSPKSPRLPDHGLQLCHSWTDASSYLQSPSSSSGASSWISSNQSQSTGTRTPSPPTYDCLSASAPASFPILGGSSASMTLGSDEGIDVDDSSDEYVPRKRRYSNRTVFKCTWPGCEKVTRRCHDIEEHVRKTHLRKMDDLEAHEEEFYFTEIQLPTDAVTESFATMFTSSPPTLSHMDMARPPHEDPEYQKQNSPPKSIRTSPKSNSVAKTVSLHRKTRGESKKCRKVYGMDNRDLWCTQCKWKKACSRFMD